MTREESLKKLEELDDKALERLATFSTNKKITAYFTNEIMYQSLILLLKSKNLM